MPDTGKESVRQRPQKMREGLGSSLPACPQQFIPFYVEMNVRISAVELGRG